MTKKEKEYFRKQWRQRQKYSDKQFNPVVVIIIILALWFALWLIYKLFLVAKT